MPGAEEKGTGTESIVRQSAVNRGTLLTLLPYVLETSLFAAISF